MSRASKTSWRELDVQQMANWDDTPRRGLLALLAFILFFVMGLYVLMPAYVHQQQEEARTQALQQQYIAAMQAKERASAVQNTSAAQALRPLNPNELSTWAVGLANNAEVRGLESVNIKPVSLDKPETPDQKVSAASVGKILISAKGPYLDILKWWADVSLNPLVLSMDQVELTGVTSNRIYGQVQVTFAQEVHP